MMREIGSEFWEVETQDKENGIFPENTQWYLSGRSALRAIIKDIEGAESVAFPAWFCDSMVKPFAEAGIRISFYPVITENRSIEDIPCDSDILLVMDYFGYTSEISFNHPCVIRDVTHSLFSSMYSDAAYYFGSLRKWSGVWTGGYAWTKEGHMLTIGEDDGSEYIAARKTAMTLKDCYINQKVDDNGKRITDKDYLCIFENAEKMLENIGNSPADKRDVAVARRINAEMIRQRRRENAAILMSSFPELLIFPILKQTDCPMFVPIIVPDGKRDELHRYLISEDIYCPVHWPISKYHDIDLKAMELYQNELSLVCDQRYSADDMHRMVKAIRFFLGRQDN